MYITQDLNQWFKNEISVLNISLNVSVQRILCVEYKSTKKKTHIIVIIDCRRNLSHNREYIIVFLSYKEKPEISNFK